MALHGKPYFGKCGLELTSLGRHTFRRENPKPDTQVEAAKIAGLWGNPQRYRFVASERLVQKRLLNPSTVISGRVAGFTTEHIANSLNNIARTKDTRIQFELASGAVNPLQKTQTDYGLVLLLECPDLAFPVRSNRGLLRRRSLPGNDESRLSSIDLGCVPIRFTRQPP